ncbi:hypothetical protein, partial [Streptomyces sp. NPDC059134]|uniref:hypothetical protein n=1 Tax=Streptomyces sp. NPDC059134 TaxID=3346738 RepID=UPI0036B6DEA5
MQIAVGGCLAQKDRVTIVGRAPGVGGVFGGGTDRTRPGRAGGARAPPAPPPPMTTMRSAAIARPSGPCS